MESHTRTIMKACTYRAFGLTMTVSVALVLTGSIKIAASIGALDTIVKIVGFYAHERVWLKIKFGLQKPAEYDI